MAMLGNSLLRYMFHGPNIGCVSLLEVKTSDWMLVEFGCLG
jgi:hypothetical protein